MVLVCKTDREWFVGPLVFSLEDGGKGSIGSTGLAAQTASRIGL